MTFRKAMIAFATLAIGLAGAGAGAAMGATSSISLNVRSGPGTGYGVVDVLHPGEQVDVTRCTPSGWCQIEHNGPDGWVSARYLTNVGGGYRDTPAYGDGNVATSRFSLNIRSGPGTGYGVVDVLSPGEQVQVTRCTSGRSWCYIEHSGPDGWVSARYLTNVGGGDDDRNTGDGVNLSLTFGIGEDGRPDFNFSFGDNQEEEPDRTRALACFFDNHDFTGARFCEGDGAARPRLDNTWNDRISSIRVAPGAKVVVCEDWYYGGRCAILTGNVSALRGPNNNNISSLRVSY